MNLDVLKTTVRFSKWRDSPGSMSLSFDVVPQDGQYIEIGDEYLFSASGYARLYGKGRILLGASVTVTDNPDVLGNLQGLFRGEKQICGSAAFYPERNGSLDSDPAAIHFTVFVEPALLAEMVRNSQHEPGGATLSLGLEGLDYGWEPDASHLIWKLEEQGKDQRPITSFSYSVERFWASEGAIRNERDRRLDVELAQSPDPKDRKLAAQSIADRPPDASTVLIKQCRALLIAILAVMLLALLNGAR